jgi:ATP-binding cassette, subfamily G (WHITE), member 2, SNQ2
MYYTFESVMVNEAASRGFECSNIDIVPQGTEFQDAAYQTCAVQSSLPGELTIMGQRYLEMVYGFYQHNLWRNVGINAAFFLFFVIFVALVLSIILGRS